MTGNRPSPEGGAPPSTGWQRFPGMRKLDLARRRRRIPHVLQTAAADCGAACLTMVLALHGKHIKLDEVRDLTGFGRDGAEAVALLRAGRLLGLRGRAYQVERLEDLRLVPRGAILHWRFHHYVVLDRVRKNGLDIVDPASGRRRVPTDEADRSFTGVVISFEPNEDFVAGGKPPKTGVLRLLAKLRPQLGRFARILATSVLLQVAMLALPLLTGAVVDRVVPRGDQHLLWMLSAGMAAIVAFHLFGALLRNHLLLHLRTALDSHLTLDFLDHLFDLPYAFFQKRSVGDLAMRLNSNATIRELLTAGTLSALLDGSLVILYLILMFAAHAGLAWLIVGLGAARILLFLATRKRHRELMAKSLQREARMRGYEIQMLSGIETLKASGTEHRASEHWSNLFVDVLNTSLERGRLNAVVDASLSALRIASPVIILLYGASRVLAGELSLGLMLALAALATGFLEPLSQLVTVAFQLQILGSYLQRIDDVLQTPKEQDKSRVRRVERLKGDIRLEAVSFRYAPFAPLVVRDVSVEISPGTFVAVVGRSGAGKSTLGMLLLGLYPPSEGRVLYDGVDLAELDLGSVRRRIGIVPQSPFFFGGSLRKNIALAEPDLHLGHVVEAARKAHIHDEITAMPMGYGTPVADGGASMSGGQRQRVALARALVHRPAILLLDEATSALDAVTESLIQKELEALRCTRIVIAHRLSTVKNADLLLVMDDGVVVEHGRPSDLLARGGAYASLVAEQVAGTNHGPRAKTDVRDSSISQ